MTVTVMLHAERPRAIRAWRRTFSDARWRVLRRGPIPVVQGDTTALDDQHARMLAHAELYGGSVIEGSAA